MHGSFEKTVWQTTPDCFRKMCHIIRSSRPDDRTVEKWSSHGLDIESDKGLYIHLTDGFYNTSHVESFACNMDLMIDDSICPPAHHQRTDEGVDEAWWRIDDINEYLQEKRHYCFFHKDWNNTIETDSLPHDCFWAAMAACKGYLKYLDDTGVVRPKSKDGYVVLAGDDELIGIDERLLKNNTVHPFVCPNGEAEVNNFRQTLWNQPPYETAV